MQNNEKLDVNGRRMVGETGNPAKEFGGGDGDQQPTASPAGSMVTSSAATWVANVAQEAESIIGEINERRKADTVLMKKLRESLLTQVDNIVQCVQDELYNYYETSNAEIKTLMDKMFDKLTNIERLQSDIDNFKSALSVFYKDLLHSSH